MREIIAGTPPSRPEADVTGDAGARPPSGQVGVWLAVVGLVYLLLVAVRLMGAGFATASGQGAERLFAVATNPFLGLMVGTVTTALVQSSSTVTSIIVGLVAGGLPVSVAVPMVMGANVGTTITNTLVSIGHVRRDDEFRRAFAAATVHDFFNLLCVAVFLPLELATGFLERSGLFLAELAGRGPSAGVAELNFVGMATQPPLDAAALLTAALPSQLAGVLMLAAGLGLILLSITYISRLLRRVMVGRANELLHAAIGRGPVTGIVSGTAVTALVQSSSTTTSLLVPLTGSGVFSLRDIYPFTLGANIGTTITALLAATAVTGPQAGLGLEIALIHLLFNVFGVVVVYGLPFLRPLPVRAAEGLAAMATERKPLALLYVLGVFFGIPGLLLLLSTVG